MKHRKPRNNKENKEDRSFPGSRRLDRDYEIFTAVAGLAAIPAVLAGGVAINGAVEAVKAVRKWHNYRPPREKMLVCPSPEDVSAAWTASRRCHNPLAALRLGALLLNVSQYVDASPIYGRGKHIVARNPGLKGWLRENCHEITYVTAMSCRKLAEVACQAIGLPEFIPLEWVMPGTEDQDNSRDFNPENKLAMKLRRAECLRQIKQCREKLSALLNGVDNVNRLHAALDAAVGGHRHRIVRKITETDAQTVAERVIQQHLRTALVTLNTLPQDKPLGEQDKLLLLLNDLKQRLERKIS